MQLGVDPTQWRKLLDSANAGELSLDPEIGKGLEEVCDNYLTRLDSILTMINGVKYVSGFGSFPSSEILQKKFTLKATGGDQSMDIVVQQHIDSVKIAKQVVAKAISNFIAMDHQHGDQITEAGR